MTRVIMPPGAARRVERILRERERVERRHLRSLDARVAAGAAAALAAIVRWGDQPWTLALHARAMREIRAAGRAFGVDLSRLARDAARDAATAGASAQGRLIATLAGAATGRRTVAPVVDPSPAFAEVDARTDDVGARAGEEVAQAAVAASFLATKKPAVAAAVAVGVAALWTRRARDNGERVVVTEMTAGWGAGGRVVLDWAGARHSRMQRYWDSTLDRRVCSICQTLHHKVVDLGQPFAAGIYAEPAHARCRCCTGPWTADWTALVDDLGIGPGPRTGVQATAETQLGSFGDRAPMLAM